ncbi:hypothetical protein KAW80_00420 [Candidatus Babeliales bacterium]|nr:hypothetical protein [Candidatus Babeliales bacterium]
MRVAFFPFYMLSTPAFEIELELMLEHKNKGDDIYVVHCKGDLPLCQNQISYHSVNLKKINCFECKFRFDQGIRLVGLPKENIFPLNNKSRFNSFPEKFNSIEELKNFTVDGSNIGLGVASTFLTTYMCDYTADCFLNHDVIINLLKTSVLIYETAIDVLNKTDADRAYILNGRFHDVWPAILACKKLGVEFLTFERGASINKYWLLKNSHILDLYYLKEDIERLWVEKNISIEEKIIIGKQWFQDKRDGVDRDWRSMTANQRRDSLPSNLDLSKRNIGIFVSSNSERVTAPDYLDHPFEDDYKVVEKILSHFEQDINYHFYVRMHPCLGVRNNQILQYEKIGQKYNNVTIIWPNMTIDSYKLLDVVETVISFGSTIGIESIFWGKPVILASRADYEDLSCYRPSSVDDLLHMLSKKLSVSDKSNAIKYGFYRSVFGEDYKYYQPKNFMSGLFLGKRLVPKYHWKNVILSCARYLNNKIKS